MSMNRRLKSLLADERGSIATLFSLTILVVMGAVGIAIDGARAYSVATRVNAALDAAALAAAKMLDDDSASDQDIRERAHRYFQAHVDSLPIHGVSIAAVQTTIDRSRSDVSVTAEVRVATTFGQIFQFDAFNFQPTATVNYAMKRIELAMALDITGSMCMPCDKIESLKVAAHEVIDTLITPHTPDGFVRIALAPYSASVNAGVYAAAVSSPPSADNCVVERSGSAAYTNAPPTSFFRLGTSSVAANPWYSCPNAPIVPLTSDPATLHAAIRALPAIGGTAGHLGAAWGWYLVSRSWAGLFPPPHQPRAPSAQLVKAVLLMTDGMFNTSYLPGPGLNSTDPAAVESSPYQALRLCENMKAEGVLVYTVAFDSPPEAENLLRTCATSAGHAFVANNRTELRAAFREIASRLASLRLTR